MHSDPRDFVEAPIGTLRRRAVPRAFVRSFVAFCLKLALVVAVVPFGSTGPFSSSAAMLAIGIVTLLSLAVRPDPARPHGLERLAWLVAGGLAIYVYVQVTGAYGLMPPNPIWAEAAAALGEPIAASPAIAPAASVAALPFVIAPLLFFIAGSRVLQSDEQALDMLSVIAVLGGASAVFGLVQFAFAPTFLLLSEKRSYLDSLTGFFVNRNTAATYFGCTILVQIALIRQRLSRSKPWTALLEMATERSVVRHDWRLAFYLVLFAATVIALLLTKSRAGVGCSAAAVAFYVSLMSIRKKRWPTSLAVMVCVVLLVAAFVILFGGQVMNRAAIRGLDDDRFCILPGLFAAVREYWPWGSGPGSFPLAFQPYRDPACGIYGSWQRAHNFFIEGSITLGAAFWVATAMVLTGLLWTLVRGLRRRRRRRFAPGLGLSLIFLLVAHDLIDFSLQIPGVALNTALALCACSALALGRERENSTR